MNRFKEVDGIITKYGTVIFFTDSDDIQHYVSIFKPSNQHYKEINVSNNLELKTSIILKTGYTNFPIVYYKQLLLSQDMKLAIQTIKSYSPQSVNTLNIENSYDFDVVVIGGGSGGNAFAKAAAELGARVCIIDYVEPSPIGTSWGYGGTCVNVGCIPKKLMHQAAIVGECIHNAHPYGYNIQQTKFSWSTLISSINSHIKSLNFNYRVQLVKHKIRYENAKAKLLSVHCIEIKDSKEITSRYIVLACGCRPIYPNDIPGVEHAITSDDLFWRNDDPGNTLIVGAGYVALECAGMLSSFGNDVTVMIRSVPLRSFDQQMAQKICHDLEQRNVRFLWNSTLVKLDKEDCNIIATININQETKPFTFKTVIMAIGRKPQLNEMGLEELGLFIDPNSGKIVTMHEKSSIQNIFAIGDCALECRAVQSCNPGGGKLGIELTPVASKSGYLLAKRIFENRQCEIMDYSFIPTTIFTPVEYGCVGYSEEEAIRLFDGKIEVYHNSLMPFEWIIHNGASNTCYVKLIVKTEDEQVIGFHCLGTNAGEITQGFVLPLKMKATKQQFDMCVGIHPSSAEVFTKLHISKSSGKDITYTGC